MLLAVFLSLTIFGACLATAEEIEQHRFIIVGAGPGGIQLAHYLDTAGRDYIVLDKASAPGSFFARFPRWRQLISINKVRTGSDDLDFNQRHDWNSLLAEPSTAADWAVGYSFDHRLAVPCASTPTADHAAARGAMPDSITTGPNASVCYAADYSSTDSRFRVSQLQKGLQFRDYTDVYYPHADHLVDYTRFWTSGEAQRGWVRGMPSNTSIANQYVPHPLNIRYNTHVVRVTRPPGYEAAYGSATASSARARLAAAEGSPRFRLHTADSRIYECVYLIFASGFQKLNPSEGINIAEEALNYWTHSSNVSDYVNKTVALIGRGNSAMEIANHILEVAAAVHVFGRPTSRLRLAWETHYPGDIRAVHGRLLETYLLKSMDATTEVEFETLEMSYINETGKYRLSNRFREQLLDKDGRELTRTIWSKDYDYVIACPGWRVDLGPFDSSIPLLPPVKGKYPAQEPTFQAINVPGLYFAGSLMHVHDFRKSSGGFIHGFRYLIRSLHRILEEEEQALALAKVTASRSTPSATGTTSASAAAHVVAIPISIGHSGQVLWSNPVSLRHSSIQVIANGVTAAASAVSTASNEHSIAVGNQPQAYASWPRRMVRGLRQAVVTMLQRINGAAAPYQMFGTILDVLVLPPLTPSLAAGFPGVGHRAALDEAESYYDPNASYPYIPQRPPSPAMLSDTQRSAKERVVNDALTGMYIEEVPMKLLPLKLPLWHSQLLAVLHAREYYPSCAEAVQRGDSTCIDPSSPWTSSAGGYEYLTVGLEFGPNETEWKREALKRHPQADIIKRAEAARDPFSLIRSNATVMHPEQSSFLHPVVRYFNTALDPTRAVAEMHIPDDFHIQWTQHTMHIMPLARFLEDIASRRAQVALAMGREAQVEHTPESFIATAEEMGVWDLQPPVDASAAVRKSLLARTWTVFRPDTSHLRQLIQMAHDLDVMECGIWVGGTKFLALPAWFHSLTVNATDALFYSAPRIFMLHTYNGGDPAVTGGKTASMAHPVHHGIHQTEPVSVMDEFHRQLSSVFPNLVLMTANVHDEHARMFAKQAGFNTLSASAIRVYDAWRGTKDLSGPDFIPQINAVVQRHAAGFETLIKTESPSSWGVRREAVNLLHNAINHDRWVLQGLSPAAVKEALEAENAARETALLQAEAKAREREIALEDARLQVDVRGKARIIGQVAGRVGGM